VERIPIFAQISKQSEKRNPTHTPQPLGFAFLQISKRPYKILTTLHPTYYWILLQGLQRLTLGGTVRGLLVDQLK
jgi:hypothetical protein